MCNHYEKNVEILSMGVRLFGETGWVMNDHGDIVCPADVQGLPLHTWPKSQAPIILQTEKGRLISLARWGARVEVKNVRGNPVAKFVTNSRDDKLTTFTWRQCVTCRRCLIPARAYYEPEGPEGAKWEVRFTLRDQPDFFLAGLWDTDPDGATRSFSMVTTAANDLAARIHDRMPLVLDDDRARRWLGDAPLTSDELRTLCRPFPAVAMTSEAMPPPERTGKYKIAKTDLPPAQGELSL